MKREELEQVREWLLTPARCNGCENCAENCQQALDLIEAELAKPRTLEWGVQYNDMGPSGLVDTETYRSTEREAREIVAGDPRRRLFTRTGVQVIPAGPWERAE